MSNDRINSESEKKEVTISYDKWEFGPIDGQEIVPYEGVVRFARVSTRYANGSSNYDNKLISHIGDLVAEVKRQTRINMISVEDYNNPVNVSIVIKKVSDTDSNPLAEKCLFGSVQKAIDFLCKEYKESKPVFYIPCDVEVEISPINTTM